jgi:hypothetical protein
VWLRKIAQPAIVGPNGAFAAERCTPAMLG